MFIDTHQHFWRYDSLRDTWIDETMSPLRKDFLPEDLYPVLQKNKVDACVAIQAAQSEDETAFLLKLAKKYPFIKGVIGWVDLLAEDVEERLAYFARNLKFKGVRHIIQSEPDGFMRKENFQNGIKKLGKFNLLYELLIYSDQLTEATHLVSRFPDQIFILNHMAKPLIKKKEVHVWKKDIHQLAQYPNTYCKLSGMVTEADWRNWKEEDFKPYLDTIFTSFGINRVLYGSDWPVCLLAAKYEEVLQIICNYIAQLSKEEQTLVMGKNATQLYNLTPELKQNGLKSERQSDYSHRRL